MTARTPDAEPLLTPAEVATMFRVDPKTVTRWAKAGKSTALSIVKGSPVRSLVDRLGFRLEKDGPVTVDFRK